ncbi:MAG: TetR/AcrR family transcriptional regulator [Bacteroidia bacterium]|nr:TetR/AcrR family transcriptional regulator [Bacteroidia bacterium]
MTTEEKILSGAQNLVFKYGIKSITMDDIAKHLGMSKKTIYSYYKDKDDILSKLVDFILEYNEKQITEISNRSKDPIDEIFQTMKIMADTFKRINPVLFFDMMKYYPSIYNRFNDFKEKVILANIEDNLKKGQELKLYRTDLNNKIIARLRLLQINIIIDGEEFSEEQFNTVEVHLQLLDHYLHGICTIKGHKLINKYKELNEEE